MINLKMFSKEVRKRLAETHYNRMVAEYDEAIRNSIEKSFVHSVGPEDAEPRVGLADIIEDAKSTYDQKMFLVTTDTVSCLFDYADKLQGPTALLNFASFKHPGGMFLNGSPAQEESLCHQSTLYNVLESFIDNYYAPHLKCLNQGLYQDDAIHSKDIVFFNYSASVINKTLNVSVDPHTTTADVITCAAPNAKTFLRRKYGITHADENILDDELTTTMCSRIQTVLDTAVLGGARNLILGAFGCGVFGNHPGVVADYFYDYLYDDYAGCFENVYFAIPNPNGNDPNYKAFRAGTETYGVICLDEEDA